MGKRLSAILISTLLLLWGVPAAAQTVTNVRAIQKGNDIEVSYFLDKAATNVQLCVSTDGGKTFSSPLRMVSGAVGDVPSGYHTILWNVLSEYGSLVCDEIVFKIVADQKRQPSASSSRKPAKTNFLIEANLAPLPQMSWGVTVGFVKKVGFYGRYLRNFGYADVNPKYKCDFEGYTDEFDHGSSSGCTNRILTSGNTLTRKYAFCVGMMFNIAGRVYPYFGAGYGEQTLYCEDLAGDYAVVSYMGLHDYTNMGGTLEAGLTLKLGSVALSAGALNTAGETTDFVLGIGYMF